MRAQAAIFGGDYLEDHPSDADTTRLQMQHGDVLVLMTDGILDNLDNKEVLKLVTGRMILAGAWSTTDEMGIVVSDQLDALSSSSSSENVQGLVATTVAGEAKHASHNFRRDGPFAKEVQRYFPGDWYRGGKVDDICVLVVVAVDESSCTL